MRSSQCPRLNLGPGRPRAPTRKTAPGWVLSYECALSELLELQSRKKGGALGICEAPTTQSWQSITLSGTYTPLDSRSHILISNCLSEIRGGPYIPIIRF